MAAQLKILASERAMELHGPGDRDPQLGIVTELRDQLPASGSPDIVVTFDEQSEVHWYGGSAPEVAATDCRVIATGGEALWRRQPLPVADALWELPPSSKTIVLLVGTPGDGRDIAEQKLRAQLPSVRAVSEITLSALSECAVVAFHGPPGRPLHGAAFTALAAGRPLIAPDSDPAFGLIAGVDHLSHHHDDELVQAAIVAVAYPFMFEPIVAMGRLAAETRRASVVYERLLIDLRLGGV
jgi:hypothetical protein